MGWKLQQLNHKAQILKFIKHKFIGTSVASTDCFIIVSLV